MFRTGIACIDLVGVECPTQASTEGGDDEVFGLGLAARIAGPWWVDLRYSEQETEAHFFDSGVPVSAPPVSFDLSQPRRPLPLPRGALVALPDRLRRRRFRRVGGQHLRAE